MGFHWPQSCQVNNEHSDWSTNCGTPDERNIYSEIFKQFFWHQLLCAVYDKFSFQWVYLWLLLLSALFSFLSAAFGWGWGFHWRYQQCLASMVCVWRSLWKIFFGTALYNLVFRILFCVILLLWIFQLFLYGCSVVVYNRIPTGVFALQFIGPVVHQSAWLFSR